MDEHKNLKHILSKTVGGVSISRILFELGEYDKLKNFVKGKGFYNELDSLAYDAQIAVKYSELDSELKLALKKYRDKVNSLNRKLWLLNILLTFIVALLNPFVTFFSKLQDIFGIEDGFITTSYVTGFDSIALNLKIFGVFQILLITYFFHVLFESSRSLYKKLIINVSIYIIISNLAFRFIETIL